MEIILSLPEFPEDDLRRLTVFSGIEERARKLPGEPWQIKTGRCNMCGKCCMNVLDGWRYGKNSETGHCAHLIYNEGWNNGETQLGYLCDMGSNRPADCSGGDEAGKDFCSVVWMNKR